MGVNDDLTIQCQTQKVATIDISTIIFSTILIITPDTIIIPDTIIMRSNQLILQPLPAKRKNAN